ncbi:MAG: alpha-2-macroglobulin family protein, partial [Owenweeksia sp.]
MKKAFAFITLLLISLFAISSCDRKTQVPAFDRSYREYINAFTSGVVSRKSTIKIHFAQKVKAQPEKDILEFKPGIKGKLVWIDDQSLEFIPDGDLQRGEIYVGELDLERIMDVPDSLKTFEFGFQVLKPAYEWGSLQLKATPETQMNYYALEGSVLSADIETPEELKGLFKAYLKGREVKVKWNNSDLARKYDFRIDSIPREEKAYNIELKVNSKTEGTKNFPDREVKMAALGEFKYLGYDMYPGTERVIVLKFTDPIKPGQDLSGYITLERAENPRFEIENTTIKVYPPENIFGTRTLRISPGIRNILDYKFSESIDEKIAFRNEKPQVEFIGEGNIIPTGDKVLVPFRAIALKAVDVKVIRIAQRNVLQFLQENSLNGNGELYRVGEIVARKKIDLQQDNRPGTDWVNYSIDLAPLIKPEPGAIYKLMISFSKDYSTYTCDEGMAPDDTDDEDDWYYDDYYYYNDYGNNAYDHSDYYFPYPRGYRWNERDNPCHVSYYSSERFASKSVLASDLGLIAKKGDKGNIDITVTDLKTTAPIGGVKVTAYSYQQKPLGNIETDTKGWASLQVNQPVYFLVATRADQKGYLKLQDGEAISLSNFKVEGEEVKKGLKGFLYGERGVWRPGDSLFLNFMLEDGAGTLPKEHPVHFELYNPNGVMVDRQISTKAAGRIYSFTTHTVPEAPTGNYKALVRVGDVNFEERIRIETVKPNRLEIDLDFKEKVQDISSGILSGDLHVEWLTGVEASNVKAKIDLKMAMESNPFPQERNFRFLDPVKHFSVEEKTWFEGSRNQSGNAEITEEIGNYSSAPGMLKARALVKAFEGGGNFSTEYFDVKLSPFSRYVGMKMPEPSRGHFLTTDKEYTVPVRTLDYKGNPVSVQNLEVKVYKVDWHWWYDSGNDYLKRYVDNEAVHLYKSGKVSTLNGRGEYKFKVDYPNWGRFLIRICDGNGHCTGELAYFDWPEGTKGDRPELSGATMLSFKPEKEEYKVGEEVVTTIPVSEGSRVLITLENGSGIIKKEWVEAKGKELTYRFKAEESMAPNVYLSASLIQPHQQTINDRPIRLFGVVPVSIVNEKTRLQPEISTVAVWRPET